MPGNGWEFFFYSCFLSLAFCIGIMPLNTFIIIVIIIVIMPYFLVAAVSQTSQEKTAKNKGRLLLSYYTFLCFKVIRDIVQLPWVYFKSPNTHFFVCFKSVMDNKKCCWVFVHCLVTYFLRHDVIRNILCVCVPVHCLVAYIFCLKTVRDEP